MHNYILLVACLLIGMLLRWSGRLPPNAASSLNAVVVNVSLPAVTLTYVHELKLAASLMLPALMAWILFGISFGIVRIIGRWMRLSRATTGGLMLTAGLANTSFIGLPMIDAFYGSQYLGLGILIDQLGSYFVLSTIGILVATIYSSADHVQFGTVVRRIARFAPFQAFVMALLLDQVSYPPVLDDLLKHLGATLVPLALISVGYQLRPSQLRGNFGTLGTGLLLKLVIFPALILALYVGVLGVTGSMLRVTVFEAAMAPMIGASIVAMEHELDPPLLTLMVTFGIPLSFLTLPAWWYALARF